MRTQAEAFQAIQRAWPAIVRDCRTVLGSELHYQAMIYHCLRANGRVPAGQVGMNVKMRIEKPVSRLFKRLDRRKNREYWGGFEPIPDIVLFTPRINADWRRRRRRETLKHMVAAIEVKASERELGRLRSGEIVLDMEKLDAHREEARARGGGFLPVMMVVDTADEGEQMTPRSLALSIKKAAELNVLFFYLSHDEAIAPQKLSRSRRPPQ